MLGPRVVGEGTERGKGESITARAKTSRYTNVSKTNQHPAFVTCRRKEICMYSHAEKRACTPSLYIAQWRSAQGVLGWGGVRTAQRT